MAYPKVHYDSVPFSKHSHSGYNIRGYSSSATTYKELFSANFSGEIPIERFGNTESQSIDLYTWYVANKYTIEFNGNGGSKPSSLNVEYR